MHNTVANKYALVERGGDFQVGHQRSAGLEEERGIQRAIVRERQGSRDETSGFER